MIKTDNMDKIFYKYRIINDNTLDSIKNKYFYFAQPSQLNDVNDSILPISYEMNIDSFINWISRNGFNSYKDQLLNNLGLFSDKTFLEKLHKEHKIINERLRIFCLSEVWDESKMWGLYADANRGICLGYKSYYNYNAYLLKVEKQNNPFIVLDGDKKVMVLLKVNYDKTEIHSFNPFQGNEKALIEAFRTKEPKWSYEKEYRVIYMNTSAIDENKKIKYDKRNLVEIIFGLRTPKDKMVEIFNIVKNNYDINKIAFYKIIHEGTIEINREKILDINNI
jgi:hypothetical protein